MSLTDLHLETHYPPTLLRGPRLTRRSETIFSPFSVAHLVVDALMSATPTGSLVLPGRPPTPYCQPNSLSKSQLRTSHWPQPPFTQLTASSLKPAEVLAPFALAEPIFLPFLAFAAALVPWPLQSAAWICAC